jgi:hypothetical protein
MDADLDYTETIVHECAGCSRACFDVQACPLCVANNDRSLLCNECRITCDECDESLCLDHISGSRICDECSRRDAIESGEALAEWKRYGRDDE